MANRTGPKMLVTSIAFVIIISAVATPSCDVCIAEEGVANCVEAVGRCVRVVGSPATVFVCDFGVHVLGAGHATRYNMDGEPCGMLAYTFSNIFFNNVLVLCTYFIIYNHEHFVNAE